MGLVARHIYLYRAAVQLKLRAAHCAMQDGNLLAMGGAPRLLRRAAQEAGESGSNMCSRKPGIFSHPDPRISRAAWCASVLVGALVCFDTLVFVPVCGVRRPILAQGGVQEPGTPICRLQLCSPAGAESSTSPMLAGCHCSWAHCFRVRAHVGLGTSSPASCGRIGCACCEFAGLCEVVAPLLTSCGYGFAFRWRLCGNESLTMMLQFASSARRLTARVACPFGFLLVRW